MNQYMYNVCVGVCVSIVLQFLIKRFVYSFQEFSVVVYSLLFINF